MKSDTILTTPIQRICYNRSFRLLLSNFFLLLILLQVSVCSGKTTNHGSIYQEVESSSFSLPPPSCHKAQRLPYSVEETNNAYQLIVDLPKSVNRKNLNVDIDYEKGIIEVLGWWMERKIRGDTPRKSCVYQTWYVDLDRLLSTGTSNTTSYSMYDLVMGIQGQRLIISLPISNAQVEEDDGDDGKITPPSSSVVKNVTGNLWKMVHGLARLNAYFQNNTVTTTTTTTSTVSVENYYHKADDSIGKMGNETIITSYLKSRQDALERFLKFSLGSTDEESYWLKKM